jgi:hypothetical protein
MGKSGFQDTVYTSRYRHLPNKGIQDMRVPILLRGALVALIVLFGIGLQSASADSGSITLTIYKGGWIIGASGGSGTLTFRGRRYRLGVGGIDYGLIFGGSKTVLHGRVRNIQRASDVAGVYAAAGAGLTVGRGVRGIVLTNQNGAILELSGRQVGLMANADLSGLAITMK